MRELSLVLGQAPPYAQARGAVLLEVKSRVYQAAVDLINERYPIGWGGAAALLTDDGTVLTSVAPEVIHAGTELYIETGAILEAHKLQKRITHSICVVREDESSDFQVLTPCGICQERLFYWGPGVQAAVTTDDGSLAFKSLQEIQPFHWYRAYRDQQK